tara:strand:+ start:1031 stop:3781 length:2751 start_codon:yes stop_codon:yes gene_type:complete
MSKHGTPKSKKDADKEIPIGGIDPNAFDAQMLLIDAYIGNLNSVGISTEVGARVADDKKVINNVPAFTSGPTSINSFMGLDIPKVRKCLNTFIKEITPFEIAQIFPKIQFFIVESASGAQFEIPLTLNPKLNSPDTGVSFYSAQSIGLKSLSLKLDGTLMPFFSKHYVVDAGFSFDSINTFTGKVPGLPITYAEVFRSSGRVGTSIYYTKLAISYDSNNEEIVNKYCLRSAEMQFFLVLQLATTKINIQENLKVDVSVKYNAREEVMFQSNIIFDFLGLNLEGKTKEVKKDIADVRFKRRALEEAKQKYYEKVRETTRGTKFYKDLKSNYETQKALVDKKSKIQEHALTRIRRGTDPHYSDAGDYLVNSAAAKNLVLQKEKLQDLKSRVDIVDEALSDTELEKKFKALKPGKDPDEELNDEEKGLVDKLASIRHKEMVEAIKDTFPTDDKKMIADKIVKTIYLTADDIYKYYNSELTSIDAKKLSSSKGAKKSKGGAPKKKTPSTVTIKKKPKKGASGKPPSPTARYEKEVDGLLEDLGSFKQIDYVLFGDLIRLVYKRLYKIKRGQIQSLKGYKPGDEDRAIKSITQSIMIFTDMIFEIFEESKKTVGRAEVVKSIYDIPIAVKNLHYILARNLYGQQKNFFTVFDLVEELISLISLTRKRKVLLLNDQANVGNYKIKSITYPLLKNPSGTGPQYRICTDPYVKQSDLYSGMLFFINRIKGNKPIPNSLGRETINPEFIFGGPDRGIIKKFQLEEITDDDIQKMVFEQLTGSDKNEIIPSFFRVNIDTIMAPIFQLGMHIKITAPTLISTARSGGAGNFFIDGDYHVRGIVHTYSSGKFTTNITATMYNSDKMRRLKDKKLVKKTPKSSEDDASAAAKEFKKDWTKAADEAAATKEGQKIIDDFKGKDIKAFSGP